MSRLVLALVLALAAAAPARADIVAPPSVWYPLPGLNAASGAQWVRALAHSTPPTTIYAGLEGGGVFRSMSGGANWSAFNSGFPNVALTNVRALLTSSTGTTVFAGTDAGLYKSTGGAWQPHAQGAEADPSNPKKLNESVQSLVGLTVPNVMLAGVFNGGVYKSTDGGDTWTPPAPGNGMPSIETVYGLTENIPGLVYATAGSGVYVSVDQGSTWNRVSDGIPGIASPITTWAYPQKPQILFTSTGSNGVYRSLNAGLTWAPINAGLLAVRARGFQIFTATEGAHLYAATEDGLWEALHGGGVNPLPPVWRKVTQNGLGNNTIMWSLTAPVITSQGNPGLIAGTQSDGGFFLAFEPPDSDCPTNHTTNVMPVCPRILNAPPVEAQTLTATSGQWTGTQLIDYAYQWQRCSGPTANTCTDIEDAEETTYTPTDVDDGFNRRFRVIVTATNPAPTFVIAERTSAITAPTGPNPANYPGSVQTSPPTIAVLDPGETTNPKVGDTMRAQDGSPVAAWFNPPATSVGYRWLRCDGSGDDCDAIPGATGRSYELTIADGTHDLRVRVTGTNGSGTAVLVSPASYEVVSLPAAVGDPLPPDEPGGAPKSQAPALTGEAYVGETLAGSVGGWKDPTTDYLRRWVRCEADGTACTYIQDLVTAGPEDGPTYVVRPGDVGYTLRLRVTADVNNDLTPDGLDNHPPNAVEVDTAASAVVTTRPVPPGPAPSAADVAGPRLSKLTLSRKAFAAGKRVVFRFTTTEPGTVRMVISKRATGRRVKGRCRPRTRANRRAKVCRYQRTVATVTRAGVAAGEVAIPFRGKVGKRKLRPGRYRATVTMRDAAGNVSNQLTVAFRIARR